MNKTFHNPPKKQTMKHKGRQKEKDKTVRQTEKSFKNGNKYFPTYNYFK